MEHVVTHSQKQSMDHAGEGIKILRERVIGLYPLNGMLSSTIADLEKNRGAPGAALERLKAMQDDLADYIANVAKDADKRRYIIGLFQNELKVQVDALRKSARVIFERASWAGASEQNKKLDYAVERLKHCSTAISYENPKKIVESALAEAKDYIEEVIAFLEIEAHRYLEKIDVQQPPPKDVVITQIKRTTWWSRAIDAVDVKIPIGVGSVDLKKLLGWKGDSKK